MNANIHDRIESIAGAIALGEADDAQRQEYRRHIADCALCLRDLGGEHEIERVAATVTAARDAETWEPRLRNIVTGRSRLRTRKLQYGLGIAGLSLALSLGVHAIVVSSLSPLNVAEQNPSLGSGVTRVSLEQGSRSGFGASVVQAPPQRQLVVTHNVVQMQRAPVNPQPATAPGSAKNARTPSRQIASIVVHPKTAPQQSAQSNRPVWEQPEQAWRTVATTTTTSQMETAPQSLTHSAESMQFGPLRRDRDVAVAGGETAINPQPPMIAYDEGAQGTAVFEVLVDERGAPTKCVITKSTNYLVLDNAVCKAAMGARYLPKIQDGRAVAGVYHDAFTFRMQENPSIEGLPHIIK